MCYDFFKDQQLSMKTKKFILRKQKGGPLYFEQQLKKAGEGLIGAGVLISHNHDNTVNIFCIFAFSIIHLIIKRIICLVILFLAQFWFNPWSTFISNHFSISHVVLEFKCTIWYLHTLWNYQFQASWMLSDFVISNSYK